MAGLHTSALRSPNTEDAHAQCNLIEWFIVFENAKFQLCFYERNILIMLFIRFEICALQSFQLETDLMQGGHSTTSSLDT